MKNTFEASQLDVLGFTQTTSALSGVANLRQFDRLQQEAVADACEGIEVAWAVQGEWRTQAGEPDQPWMHLQAQVTLPLLCQRCLSPVSVPVSVSGTFRFVADEETAMAQDGESEEDVLVQSRSFDLLSLIEDELLMALPVLSLHEACPVPTLPPGRAVQQEPPETERRPHPFASLAQLVNKRSAQGGD
jgi:uncharacterized protein